MCDSIFHNYISWSTKRRLKFAVEVMNAKESPKRVKELMAKNGYTYYAAVTHLKDLIFIKAELAES